MKADCINFFADGAEDGEQLAAFFVNGFHIGLLGVVCFGYDLQPVLGFAGFALAYPDSALEVRLAARSVSLPVIGADRAR